MTKKILNIFGTRPEAIKMAPIILALQNDPDFSSTVCVTAQHRELLDQVLDLFSIKPDIDLNLMEPDQSLKEITVSILNDLEPIIEDLQPDWILVQGDTTTVMAASLLAYYKKIKVGHVEAGLRTYDIFQPFPEEVNRRIVGNIATLHFSPTEQTRANLVKEGVPPFNVLVTGNTVIDAVQIVSQLPFTVERSSLRSLPQDKPYVLVTSHRRENFGKPLENICNAIVELADQFKEMYHFVYPVHLNPNVRDVVVPRLSHHAAITLLEPVSYRELIYLVEKSELILTDSGGLQEEGPALQKPVLVLREKTERPEGINSGVAILVGTDKAEIVDKAGELLKT